MNPWKLRAENWSDAGNIAVRIYDFWHVTESGRFRGPWDHVLAIHSRENGEIISIRINGKPLF